MKIALLLTLSLPVLGWAEESEAPALPWQGVESCAWVHLQGSKKADSGSWESLSAGQRMTTFQKADAQCSAALKAYDKTEEETNVRAILALTKEDLEGIGFAKGKEVRERLEGRKEDERTNLRERDGRPDAPENPDAVDKKMTEEQQKAFAADSARSQTTTGQSLGRASTVAALWGGKANPGFGGSGKEGGVSAVGYAPGAAPARETDFKANPTDPQLARLNHQSLNSAIPAPNSGAAPIAKDESKGGGAWAKVSEVKQGLADGYAKRAETNEAKSEAYKAQAAESLQKKDYLAYVGDKANQYGHKFTGTVDRVGQSLCSDTTKTVANLTPVGVVNDVRDFKDKPSWTGAGMIMLGVIPGEKAVGALFKTAKGAEAAVSTARVAEDAVRTEKAAAGVVTTAKAAGEAERDVAASVRAAAKEKGVVVGVENAGDQALTIHNIRKPAGVNADALGTVADQLPSGHKVVAPEVIGPGFAKKFPEKFDNVKIDNVKVPGDKIKQYKDGKIPLDEVAPPHIAKEVEAGTTKLTDVPKRIREDLQSGKLQPKDVVDSTVDASGKKKGFKYGILEMSMSGTAR